MPILNRGLLNSTALTNVALLSAGLMLVSAPAMALNQNTLPTGGQVIGGQATISQAGNTLNVTQQTNNAAINWQSFSIGSAATTNFFQPSANSIAVNRVVGVDPSQIEGHLHANGQVVLVNPNGILFSKSARVDVGGLVASTSGISEKNAIDGKLIFDQGSNANAKIVNDGRITAKDGGLVALVSPSVINNGVITAKLGKVSLAAGNKWTLDLYGDNLVNFALNDKVVGEVKNAGVISANGGAVQITANVAKDVVSNAINMTGVIEANSVSQSGGTILLEADAGNVAVSGKLSATGTTGGIIDVTGNSVTLDGATIDASGANGGGTINIGGESHGGGALAHANTVTANTSTKLIANATKTGNAGNVTVWSDGKTNFAGSATAKSKTGNGGSVETSGHDLTIDNAQVNVSGATGNGSWLLDPFDLTINQAGAVAIEQGLATGNVFVQTSATGSTTGDGSVTTGTGNINVDAGITWSSASSLVLSAYDSVNVNANIVDNGTGNITLRADNAARGVTVAGKVTFTGSDAKTQGAVSIYYDDVNYAQPVSYSSAVTAGKGLTAYMLVDSAADLTRINTNLAGTYALGKNITLSGQFAPIGSVSSPFTGTFDGNGGIGSQYTISALTVGAAGQIDVGLFANNAGTIRNTSLSKVIAYGLGNVGALAGENSGTLLNDTVTGFTIYSDNISHSIGGLVGYNSLSGKVLDDSLFGTVSAGAGSQYIGGVIGANYGYASGSSFSGTVTAGCDYVGGFVGTNYGTVVNSTATGYVINGSGSDLGGFAGQNAGVLSNDSATATHVIGGTSNTNVGGFVGENTLQGVLTGNSVSGTVTAGSASNNVGGLAGYNAGVLNGNTAATTVLAGSNSTNVGGYVGLNQNATISSVSIVGNVIVGANSINVGGLVGYNEHGSLLNDTVYANVLTGTEGGSVGGEVGLNSGVVSGAHVSGLVRVGQSSQYIGGVIGANYGNVSGGTFTGSVLAGCDFVGGFVGGNFATIVDSTSSAYVNNGSGGQVGGFAGLNADFLSGDSAVNARVVVAVSNHDTGDFVGLNTTTGSIFNSFATGTVSAGTLNTAIGGFAGYNDGKISNATFAGSIAVGNNNVYVGGGIGWNDAGGSVSGISVAASIVSGSNSTAVGGIVGLNGSNPIIAHGGGSYADAAATIKTGSFNGTVTVGNNSFAVGGLAGWDSSWKATNGSVATGVLSGLTGTGLVTASANGGTTYIHDANQVGCEEVGGNCFGVAGKEVITVTPNSLTTTYGQTQNPLTYGLSYTAPGGNANGLESGDQASNVLQVNLQNSQTNAGSSQITGSANVNPNNANALLDYTVVFNNTNSTVTVNKAGLTVTANGSQTYGGTNKQVSYTYAGLVNGNTSGVVTGVSYSTPVTSLSNAGTYGITATGGTAQNYTITDATGVYTVNKAGLTVTANGSQTYGGTNKQVSYTYAGLVNGNTSGVVTGVSYSTPVTSLSNAGTYGITATGGTAQNYTITDATGVYTVNKAGLTVTANGSQTYGGTNKQVSYTYAGLVNGNTSGVVTGVSYSTPVTSLSNAGTYGITATGGTAQNYTITDATGVYTVNKAGLTVTANGSQTYGGTNKQVSYTYAGLVNGNTSGVVTGVSYSTPVTSLSNAGTYGITATGGTAQNYTITDATGVYTVNKAGLTVTANGSQTYGGTNKQVSYTYAGLVNGNTSGVVTGVSYSTPVTSLSNAGTYGITATGGTAQNYTITDATGVYTVNKAGLTVTANGSQTYGGTNKQVSYTYAGLVNGNTSGVVTGVSYSTPVTSLSNAGTYGITATGGTAQNYTITDATGVYTVNKAGLTVTANGSQTYGGTNKQVSYTYAGLVNGNTSGVVTGVSYSTPVTSLSNAGTYGITATGGTAQNYTITDATGVYTVNKAGLTVTANGSQTYGGTNKQVSYTYAGLVNGNTSGVVTGVSYSTPVTSLSNAGTYGITATGGTAQNYTITDATGVYTVNKAGLTVTANGSQTYGGTNKQVSYTYAGLVNGNTSGVVTGVSYSTPVTSLSNAGTYGITATGGTAQNYTITDATGVYTVNKAGLTVTANGSQTYGGTNKQVSYTYAGLVNGNTSGVVTGVSYSTPVTSLSNAGTYGITATGGTAQNYTITDATGVYTVNKAGLTVTANGSQTYGGTNKQVSYTYAGLVNGNTSGVVTGVSYSTPVTSLSNAGTYGITATGGTAQNYTITDATGVYTVNKAPLTIGVTGSQTYGGTNPTVSYTYAGLVNGNTSGVVTGVGYTTPATSKSDVGTYTITETGGTAQNYTISPAAPGVFQVNPASLIISANDATRTQGTNTPSFSATFTGLVNNDASSVVTGLAYTPGNTSGIAPGTYTNLINVSGGMAHNYTITYRQGTLTVLPAGTTGVITPGTPTVPGQVENVTGQVSGLNALLIAFNLASNNQVNCLKVNSEVRGVTTDSPIDCAAPLQVNGF